MHWQMHLKTYWVMQVLLSELDEAILEKIFYMVCTDAAAASAFRRTCRSMRRIGDECWARLLELWRSAFVLVASDHDKCMIQFSVLLFNYMDLLLTEAGYQVILNGQVHPYPIDSTTCVIATVDAISQFLSKCVETLKENTYVAKCTSVEHTRTAVHFVPNNANVEAMFMISNRQIYMYCAEEITVRMTANIRSPIENNPVTLSLCVRSHEAAMEVQGFLLFMGCVCLSFPFLMGESGEPILSMPVDVRDCDAFDKWQRHFRKRNHKPDVEVRLEGVQTWAPAPSGSAFAEVPITSPGAWQTLANVFQNLEVCSETSPTRASRFNPAGPTVFGTLRVLCDHGVTCNTMAHATPRTCQSSKETPGSNAAVIPARMVLNVRLV